VHRNPEDNMEQPGFANRTANPGCLPCRYFNVMYRFYSGSRILQTNILAFNQLDIQMSNPEGHRCYP
jgi:hypothetical protein